MAVYCQSTIEVRSTGFVRFLEAMPGLVKIVEGAGWKLLGAYTQTSGRLFTVIDIWELDDLNHFQKALAALHSAPEFATIAPVLAETIERETVVFMDAAPYFTPK